MSRVSLKIKILGIVVTTMMLSMGLILWQNLQTQTAMIEKASAEYTRMVAETIQNSFITAMASGKNTEVVSILERVNQSEAIKSVRIYGPDGKILLSADPHETGKVLDSESLEKLRGGHPIEEPHIHSGSQVYSTVLPISNSQACHQCHGPELPILGFLDVHTTLEHLDSIERAGRQATIFTSIAVLMLIVSVISVFFFIYVEKPVQKLVGAMMHVERGEFQASSIHLNNSAEVSLLSTKFNAMVSHLQDLITSKLHNEKELAVQKEKLAHHEEIRQMNLTLEDRLKEIEHLNISLEERIEEIEEANYKIADLASDVEGKNATLQVAVNRLSTLYKMGLALNSTIEPRQLFELLLHKTSATLQADIGYLLLKDPEDDHYVIGAVHGVESKFNQDEKIPILSGGISKWVIEKRHPLLVKDVRKTDLFSDVGFLGFHRRTVICAPLTIKGLVIGTLTIANKTDGSTFCEEDLELLSTIAAQASIAINNARLYEEQEMTYLSTVQALVSAIEASDSYTRGHSERVKRYSLAIAEQMGLDKEVMKRLEQAAILHDIGKIGIDITLLHKEDKLTDSDIENLQQHPHIGDSILSPISFLKDVRTIISQHHERIDGKGYPSGISGQDIHIEARILAVADTFDAMTSDRPYRKALSTQVAIAEILEHSGTQFDPQIAQVFVDLFKEERLAI